MNSRKNEKGFIKGLVLVVVGACILFIVFAALARFIAPNGGSLSGPNPSGGTFSGGSSYLEVRTNPLLDFGITGGDYGSYSPSRAVSSNDGKGASPYAGKVSLSTGNVYTIQPSEEYLVLRNTGGPVDITGWTFTNSKGTRPVESSVNSYYYPTADSATIGQGIEFVDPSGSHRTGPIILKSGDTAYVTTGYAFGQFPLPIPNSFRENICLGYLDTYPFQPSISRNCPYIANDPSINTVTDECYDYLRYLGRCVDPEKNDKKRFDALTSQCKAFARSRLNYPSCVALHKNDAGFYQNQWRIYLGKSMGLWAANRETITLYDKNGLIVDRIAY